MSEYVGFWITLPKNHFTEIFWPKGHLNETPFDRTPFDRMPFDRKFIRPNRRLTERCLTEISVYWKVIWPIFFRKWSLDRIYFPQEISFNRKKIAHKVVWPKIHLTESFFRKWSFDRKVIGPKAIFEKWTFNSKVIWPIFFFFF
jgi:hypothetical protein